jgi:hypothetical protein
MNTNHVFNMDGTQNNVEWIQHANTQIKGESTFKGPTWEIS